MKKYKIKEIDESLFFVNTEDDSEVYKFIGHSKFITLGKEYREDWVYIQRDSAWLRASYLNRIKHKFDGSK